VKTQQPIILPNLPEVELSVLGAMMGGKSAVEAATQILAPANLFSKANREVFGAIVQVYEEGATPNIINVAAKLRGMEAYIIEAEMKACSPANLDHAIRAIKEKAILRELMALGVSVQAAAINEQDPFELITTISDAITELTTTAGRANTSESASKLVHAIMTEIDDLVNGGIKKRSVYTGYHAYDYLTNGFVRKRLIVCAGRPSMGKTAFAVNCAANIAKSGHGVGIFSLEQSKEELMMRLLCRECGMRYNDVQAGRVNPKTMPLAQGLSNLSRLNLIIDDASGITAHQIRARAQKMIRDNGIAGIIIDYLGLMSATEARTRDEEIGIITKALKAVAKDLNIFVLLLSQLNRQVDTRKNKRPTLSDLRESGNIEQDADDVVFIHRPEYYDEEDEPGVAEIIIEKQRNGDTGTVKLNFVKEYMKFENPAPPGMNDLLKSAPPPEREEE
jgi:replicative DNA helicase